jgi:peroxin-19
MSKKDNTSTDRNMDEILDSALDELYSGSSSSDEEEEEEVATAIQGSANRVAATSSSSGTPTEGESSTTSSGKGSLSEEQHPATVEDAVAKMLQSMGGISSNTTTANNDKDHDFMEQLMKEMEQHATIMASQPNDNSEYDSMFNNVMNQLLAKDIMYEPMKQITEAFPKFLQQKKDKLSNEEYQRYVNIPCTSLLFYFSSLVPFSFLHQTCPICYSFSFQPCGLLYRYGHQYQHFQRLIHVYETDPENYEKLTELMQEIQQYGQPPPEILQEVAPDLKFNSDGLPIVEDMVLPPGMDQECCIM